jgi:hypothetical protein
MTKAEQIAKQEFFTIPDAVIFLRSLGIDDVTEWAIHEKIREGKLPRVPFGRRFKVAKDDLLAMLKIIRKRTRSA